MGMYDTIIVTCPHCKKVTDEQTKDFDCCLQTFDLDKPIAPHYADSFSGEWVCLECGKKFYVENNTPTQDVIVEVTKDKPTED